MARGIDERKSTWEEPESSAGGGENEKTQKQSPETQRLGPRTRERSAGTVSINTCDPSEVGTRCGVARQVSSTGA